MSPGGESDPAPGPPGFDALLAYAPAPDLLRGRAVLVTGAAAGIGRAVSAAAARLGAATILLDNNRRGLEALGEEISAAGGPEPELVAMDLSLATTADYRNLAREVGKRFGRLDGLVNNAGRIGALTPFEHADPQLWSQVATINLVAPFFLTQWCMPLLRKAEDPALVFSLHRTQRAFWGAYGVAKAGLEALMHIVADEYHLGGASPVRVFGIDPGPVVTAERRRHYPGEAVDAHPAPEAIVGPYLFALGPDARGLTDVVLRRR